MRQGVLLVRARRELRVRAFMALDLPAFERPAKATSAPVSGGHCLSRLALIKNEALRKLICNADIGRP